MSPIGATLAITPWAILLAAGLVFEARNWLERRRVRADAKQDAWDAHWLSVEQGLHAAIDAADSNPDVILADDFRLWREAADWFGGFARELADIRALPCAEPQRTLRL